MLTAFIMLALCSFSNAYANPNEFKWVFLAACNFVVLLELAIWPATFPLVLDRLDAWLLAFIAYAGVSLTWSADAAAGLLVWVKWLLLAGPFLYFRHLASDSLLRLSLRSVGLANAVVMVFAISGWANWAGFANENFLTEFQLISLPFLAALILAESSYWLKLPAALVAGLELLDLAVFNPSRIEWLVLLGLLILAMEVFIGRRLRLRSMLVLNGIAIAAAVGLLAWAGLHADSVHALFVESVRPRLALIVNTLRLWWDAPLFGHGAGGFDALYPIYKEWHLNYFEHADILLSNKMVKAGAAHNELLQLLADYGLVGLGILGGFGWIMLRQGLRRRDRHAAVGGAALCVGLLIGLIEFPLQNPATGLLLVLAAAMLSRREECQAYVAGRVWAKGPLRIAGRFGALATGVLLLFGMLRFDQSNRLFGQVAGLMGSDPRAAFEANQDACRLNPWDRRMRLQLYTTLTFWTANSAVAVSSDAENDRVYAFSSRGAEHQPVLLLGRLQHLLNSGRYETQREETEALLETLKRESSRMADVWILEAYYALLLEHPERAAAAIRRAQGLDTTPAQRENLERLRQAL
jgi:O-antigen ligase